ncbi:MAG: hypothetical protein WD876_03065 [Candidatus Pacearchaeota archaeon]
MKQSQKNKLVGIGKSGLELLTLASTGFLAAAGAKEFIGDSPYVNISALALGIETGIYFVKWVKHSFDSNLFRRPSINHDLVYPATFVGLTTPTLLYVIKQF